VALELTTSFRNISTAGGKLDGREAAAKAAAHLRYITRGPALEDVANAGLPPGSPADQRAAMQQAFRSAGERGGKTGSRVAEKITVTLPNSWPREARKEALQRLCDHLAPDGSDAWAFGVTHRDKRGTAQPNEHIHIIAQDGAESRESALTRRQASQSEAEEDAVLGASGKRKVRRVRRQNVIRLGDRSRAKEMRTEMAGILNDIAETRGIERVEHRSFKERGIEDEPMRHEGPKVRAVAEKTGHDPSTKIDANRRIRAKRQSLFSSTLMTQPIDDLFGDETPTEKPGKGPPPGWVPPPDKVADDAFNRAERRRQAALDAVRRREDQRVRERIRTMKKRKGPPSIDQR